MAASSGSLRPNACATLGLMATANCAGPAGGGRLVPWLMMVSAAWRAAWLGVVPAAVLGGLCTLGVVGGWTLGFKQLRTVDRFEEAANAH